MIRAHADRHVRWPRLQPFTNTRRGSGTRRNTQSSAAVALDVPAVVYGDVRVARPVGATASPRTRAGAGGTYSIRPARTGWGCSRSSTPAPYDWGRHWHPRRRRRTSIPARTTGSPSSHPHLRSTPAAGPARPAAPRTRTVPHAHTASAPPARPAPTAPAPPPRCWPTASPAPAGHCRPCIRPPRPRPAAQPARDPARTPFRSPTYPPRFNRFHGAGYPPSGGEAHGPGPGREDRLVTES